MTSQPLRLAAALALLATSACVQIEADLPEICRHAELTYTSPQNALVSDTTEQAVDFLPSDMKDLLTELTLTSGSVTVTPAGAIDELKVLARPSTGSTDFDLTLLHMKPVGAGGPVPDSRADLLPYLGGQLVFQVMGTPPDGTKFDISVCASAKAMKEFRLSN